MKSNVKSNVISNVKPCVRRGVAVRERVLGEGWLWEHESKTGDGGGTATKKKTNMKSNIDSKMESN